jgi:hypothetical protein
MENHGVQAEIKKKHKLILAIGLLFISIGIIIQLVLSKEVTLTATTVCDFAIVFFGLVFLYFAFINKISMLKFFLGLFFSFTGIFLLIVHAHFLSASIKKLWPLIVLFAGFSLIFSAILSKKRITVSLLIPSLFLIFLSVLFLIFSLDIVTKSLISVAINFLPWLLILSGFVLFGSFFYIQSGKQHISPDLIEDDDEE